MASVREELAALLAEKPGLRDDLEELRRIDAAGAPWTFDEIPLDSGQFGELVARGIAEAHDEGYRLVDPEAVEAVLEGESTADSPAHPSPGLDPGTARETVTAFLQVRGRPERVALLVGVLGLLVALRLLSFPAVFRDGAVVLSGNDPYLYRYWVEQLLAIGPSEGPSLGGLPVAIATGEPLLVIVLWALSRLAGDTPSAAGIVLAWYPVVASVICGSP